MVTRSVSRSPATSMMPARILYIEQEMALGQLFKKKLEKVGYVVDWVQDGVMGLALLDRNRRPYAAVAMTDDLPPPTNGLTLLKQLLHHSTEPVVLFLARQGNEGTAVAALSHGAENFLIKDQGGRYLLLLPAVIAKLLARRQLTKERLDMLAELKKQNEILALLNHVSQQITSTLEFNTVIEQLMSSTIEVLQAQGCSLWLWDEHRQYLVCHAVIDRGEPPPLRGMRVAAGQGVVGWVALHKRSEIVPHTTADNRFHGAIDTQINYQTQSLLAVPMRLQHEVTGVLEVVNKLEGVFDEHDRELARTLATTAAASIQNAQLVATLTRRTEQLEERNNELDAFAHTVAHDLQNMLARIVGFAELMAYELDSAEEQLPREQLRKATLTIAQNGRKMSRVLEGLLMLAAVREAKVQFHALDMGGVVEEAIERLLDQIQEQGARLDFPDSWPTAVGFAPWIEEVWYNYLSNGLKYGGNPVHLQLGAYPASIEGQTCFYVQDNGGGVSAKDQKLLFIPFSRIGRKRQAGHGLGLSIVERIVTKMGGTVGMESVDGGGSRFYFTLPDALPGRTL